MGLFLITPPQREPIDFSEAKLQLRVEDYEAEEDLIVFACIKAAREYVEQVTGRQLITATWELRIDEFEDEIRLPRAPLQSIVTVKYLDSAGVLQTVPSTVYEIDTSALPGRIRLAYDQVWPETLDHKDAIRIQYLAGYGDMPASVPEPLRAALRLQLAWLYEQRESVITGTISSPAPLAFDALLSPYRILLP